RRGDRARRRRGAAARGQGPRRPEALGRSADRREHRRAGDRGADAVDRAERRRGGVDRRVEGQGSEGRGRLQRPDGQVREPRAGGGDRSHQGRALGATELVVDRVAAAHHRSARIRDSGREEGSAGAGRWRYGGNVLTWKSEVESRKSKVESRKSRVQEEGPASSRCAGPFFVSRVSKLET